MAGGRELVVSFGEMLIDFVPTVAGVSLAEAPAFLKAPGGAPANVAIAVSRLGGEAAFVGKLGDDEFGRMLAAILRDNGVDAGGVVFDAGARTALAFVTLRADGEREFMFYRNPSADMLLTADELNVELIKRDFHGAVPSFKVQQVDTTGAGDAFVGALLKRIVKDPSSLQDQKKLEEAIKFANACGAITATKKGAIPSLPTETEVLQLIAKA
ncbi:unnamed protein product [Urochloa humidicola]